MGLQINRKSKTIRVGSTLSLVLGIIAFLVAIPLSGWLCLLIIPLYFLSLIGSILGIVPFVGPLLYYFGIGWIFNIITTSTGLDPISSGILFYSNLAFSILYCFVTSSLLVLWIAFRRKLNKLKKLKEILNHATDKKDQSA